MNGLQSMNEAGYVHRDIKPGNFLLTNDYETIKISDLGMAAHFEGDASLSDQMGTIYFQSPEMFRAEGYGPKNDIWAVGVTMYKLMTHRFPFENAETKDCNIAAVLFEPAPPIDSSYSNELKDLVLSMLSKTPKERPSIRQLQDSSVMKRYAEERSKMSPKKPKLFEEYGKLMEERKK